MNKTKLITGIFIITVLLTVGGVNIFRFMKSSTTSKSKPLILSEDSKQNLNADKKNKSILAASRSSSTTTEQDNRTFDITNDSVSLYSQLPYDNAKKAIVFFESQRKSWLAIRSVKARYKRTTWMSNTPEFNTLTPRIVQTGTIEFLVEPLKMLQNNNRVRIRFRLSNDEGTAYCIKNDINDPKVAPMYWSNSSDSTPSKDFVYQYDRFPIQNMIMPLRYMHNISNSPEQITAFYAESGIPRRLSSDQETNTLFGGEPQYLFFPDSDTFNKLWLSKNTGQLRCIDTGNTHSSLMVKSLYEHYLEDTKKQIAFPTKYTRLFEQKKTFFTQAQYGKEVVELTDVKLNSDIMVDFEVPDNAIRLKK